jgi:hypothetical protein
MSLVAIADSWQNRSMTVSNKVGRTEAAPALYRLLADSALSRAALGCCGVPVAMLDATGKAPALRYVNAAFESFFGFGESESLGRSLAALLFQGDE